MWALGMQNDERCTMHEDAGVRTQPRNRHEVVATKRCRDLIGGARDVGGDWRRSRHDVEKARRRGGEEARKH